MLYFLLLSRLKTDTTQYSSYYCIEAPIERNDKITRDVHTCKLHVGEMSKVGRKAKEVQGFLVVLNTPRSHYLRDLLPFYGLCNCIYESSFGHFWRKFVQKLGLVFRSKVKLLSVCRNTRK